MQPRGLAWQGRGENVLPKFITLDGGTHVPIPHVADQTSAQGAGQYGPGRGGPSHSNQTHGRGAMGYDRQTGHPYGARGGDRNGGRDSGRGGGGRGDRRGNF